MYWVHITNQNQNIKINAQGCKLLDILEVLSNIEIAKELDVTVTSFGRLRIHFCSDTNLSRRVLSDAEKRHLKNA